MNDGLRSVCPRFHETAAIYKKITQVKLSSLFRPFSHWNHNGEVGEQDKRGEPRVGMGDRDLASVF
jgi:hypothetical protein